MTRANPSQVRRSQRGIALIEALVAILIFAFGIVGLVGLQAAMTRAQGSAKLRADAAYLGSQVIGTMWADRSNIAQYDSASCSGYNPCKDWLAKVGAGLPAGAATISANSSGSVTLTVTWSTSAEGTHSHVLTTAIR